MNNKDDFKLMIKEMQLAGYNVKYDGNRRAVAPVKAPGPFSFLYDLWKGSPTELHLRMEPFGCVLLVVQGNYIGDMKRIKTMEEAGQYFRFTLDRYGV